jgi:hypothetical protein
VRRHRPRRGSRGRRLNQAGGRLAPIGGRFATVATRQASPTLSSERDSRGSGCLVVGMGWCARRSRGRTTAAPACRRRAAALPSRLRSSGGMADQDPLERGAGSPPVTGSGPRPLSNGPGTSAARTSRQRKGVRMTRPPHTAAGPALGRAPAAVAGSGARTGRSQAASATPPAEGAVPCVRSTQRSSASTMVGSNWLPRCLRSSATAALGGSAAR